MSETRPAHSIVLKVHTHPDNLMNFYAYKVGLQGPVLSKDGLGARPMVVQGRQLNGTLSRVSDVPLIRLV